MYKILILTSLIAWQVPAVVMADFLPDYDFRHEEAHFEKAIGSPYYHEQDQRRVSFVLSHPGVQIDLNSQTASPSFIRNLRRGRHITEAQFKEAWTVARDFVEEHAAFLGFSNGLPDDFRKEKLKRSATPPEGISHFRYQQTYKGRDIYGAGLRLSLSEEGELITVSSELFPIDSLEADPREEGGLSDVALQHAASEAIGLEKIVMSKRDRVVYFPVALGDLRLAKEMTIECPYTHRLYQVVVDAMTGDLLYRKNFSGHFDFKYHVYADPITQQPYDSPAPWAPGPDEPTIFQPSPLVLDFLQEPFAPFIHSEVSPMGWVFNNDSFQNVTKGNNVDAYLDWNAENAPSHPRPQAEEVDGELVFQEKFKLEEEPEEYSEASAIQAFYLANWFHDRTYQLGFTEEFANFQEHNFDRGGNSGDSIQMQVQWGLEEGMANNPFFSGLPLDGYPAFIRLPIWDGPSPSRDSSLDAHVVIHELAHGMTIRMGGGFGGTVGSSARRQHLQVMEGGWHRERAREEVFFHIQ